MGTEARTIKLNRLLGEIKDNQQAAHRYQAGSERNLKLVTLAWNAMKDEIDGLGKDLSDLSLTLRMAYGEVWRFNTFFDDNHVMAAITPRTKISLATAEHHLSAYLGMNP